MTAADTRSTPPSTQDGGHALFAWLREMRDERPVWQDARGIHHVFRHDAVRRVLTEHETFSSDRSRFMPAGADISRGNLPMTDPPEHDRLRRMVSQAFTPRAVAALEPRIAALTDELLAAAGTEFDLVTTLARPLPVIVIAEMLGVEPADRELFGKWADDLLAVQAGELGNEDVAAAVGAAMQGLFEYMLAVAARRRAHPADDLVSRLLVTPADGPGLDDEEVARLSTVLLFAGHVTTTVLLGNLVLCLADAPEVAAGLRADRTLIPGAIEETLRYRSSFIQSGRLTTRPTTIDGVEVPAGAYVSGWLLSANHDERQFSDPETFDPRRRDGAHLAFGHGIHYCVGAMLAKLEARVALERLFDRYAELRPAPGAPLSFFDDGTTFGVRHLPVSVRAR